MAGFYVHVPFCLSKCIYCDFYSVVDNELIEQYGIAVLDEIDKLSQKYPNKKIETIYFGGGTPSVLPLSLVKAIVDRIKNSFCCDLEEVTLELNPNVSSNLEGYKECGINRISMGVQSMDDKLLAWLGRRHTSKEAYDCIRRARELGYNISVDLLLGIPNSTNAELKNSIDVLAPLVDHVSAYILKVEQHTRLYHLVNSGEVAMPSDDDVADCYDLAVSELAKHGLMQYEISNFSRVNRESIHNLKYWTLDDYIGVGPSAHSLVDGKRYYNTPSLADYISGKHSGNDNQILEEDSDIEGVDEYVMLGLRLNKGVSIAECKARYGVDILDRYKQGLAKLKDFLTVKDGYISINQDKMLLQNNILLILFDR